MVPEEVIQRYNLVVDGELYDGKRVRHLLKEQIIADRIAHETLTIRNEFDSLNGKYWDLVGKFSDLEGELSRGIPMPRRVIKRSDDLAQVSSQALTGFQGIRSKELIAEVVRRIRRRILG
jgi:hypothetical protein